MTTPDFLSPEYKETEILENEKSGKRGFTYLLEEKVAWALNAALTTKRPLLVVGKPGVGKSQIAPAAAQVLKCPYYFYAVNSRTEPESLLYQFDAVGRLSKAQLLSQSSTDDEREKVLNSETFLSPGVLWQALNPEDAQQRNKPITPEGDPKKIQHTVLLIDEIDKADSDVPNSLLDTLDNKRFDCPHLNGDQWVEQQPGLTPLVIFTSNQERDLPQAFIRRCIVLQLSMGNNPAEQERWLTQRVKAHFPEDSYSELYHPCHPQSPEGISSEDNEQNEQQTLPDLNTIEAAIKFFVSQINQTQTGDVEPSLAELLDLLRALAEVAKDKNKNLVTAMAMLQQFTLQKAEALEL